MGPSPKMAKPPPTMSLREVEALIAVALMAAVVADVHFDVLDHLMDALRDMQKGVRTFN